MRQADRREAGIRRAAAGCSGALDAQRSKKLFFMDAEKG
jgi:hypothetical protein